MMSVVAALPLPVVFAAGIDWLEAILPILFVGFWILSQVFAVLRRVAGGPARPPVIRVPDLARAEPARPRPPGQPEIDPRAELDRQITDFLRKVTGEPPQPAASRSEAAGGPPRPKRSAPVGQQPRPASSSAATGSERTQAIGDRHVGTLDTQPSDVARHVQDAFKQQLGHLHSGLERPGDDAASTETARRSAAGRVTPRDLVTAARDPATIRQAILLREILERPVDRW